MAPDFSIRPALLPARFQAQPRARDFLSSLPPELRDAPRAIFGDFTEELLSLSHEADRALYLEGLDYLGSCLEIRGYEEAARLVFAYLASEGAANPQAVAGPLAARARSHLALLSGANRLDVAYLAHLGRRLLQNTLEPSGLAGMAAGNIFSRLGRLVGARFFSGIVPGVGLKVCSYLTGFLFEVTAFTAAARGVSVLRGRQSLGNAESWKREWLGTALTLGALHLTGAGARQLSSIAGANPAVQRGFGQAGMLSGIYLAQGGEMMLEWRPPSAPETFLLDGIATWAQFNVAAFALRRLMGPSFENWERRADREFALTLSFERRLDAVEAQLKSAAYLTGSRQELARKRPDAEMIDGIFQAQLENFFGALRMDYRWTDTDVYFHPAPENPGESLDPAFVRAALERHDSRGQNSNARRVLEVRVPCDDFIPFALSGKAAETSDLLAFGPLFSAEESFGRKLHFTGRDGDHYLFRIPSLSLFESFIKERFGDRAFQIHEVEGAPHRDVVMELRSRRVAPLSINRGRIFLGDLGREVDPVFMTAHDLFVHAVQDSANAPGIPELSLALYRWVRRMPDVPRNAESLLDRLADMELFLRGSQLRADLIRLMIQRMPTEIDRTLQGPDAIRRQKRLEELHGMVASLESHYRVFLEANPTFVEFEGEDWASLRRHAQAWRARRR